MNFPILHILMISKLSSIELFKGLTVNECVTNVTFDLSRLFLNSETLYIFVIKIQSLADITNVTLVTINYINS